MLANPTAKLKNYTVPLHPMLGCIGVAPPGDMVFRSGFLGAFGGNMDYNQMREGITVYLPVFQPGALLFMGDGHAAQGDGELTGNALETSMDIEFTVDVIMTRPVARAARAPRTKSISWRWESPARSPKALDKKPPLSSPAGSSAITVSNPAEVSSVLGTADALRHRRSGGPVCERRGQGRQKGAQPRTESAVSKLPRATISWSYSVAATIRSSARVRRRSSGWGRSSAAGPTLPGRCRRISTY